jgi:hypothetical protein
LTSRSFHYFFFLIKMNDDFEETFILSTENSSEENIENVGNVENVGNNNQRKRPRKENSNKSFVWKHFKKSKDETTLEEIMRCSVIDKNGKQCETHYLAFGSTSNAIQHLANVHNIVDEDKLHVKVKSYLIIIILYIIV